MDKKESAASLLLSIALPIAESAILKDMVSREEGGSSSFPEMKEYDSGNIGIDVLKRAVLHKVVQFYYEFCFGQYNALFAPFPTERVKLMVRDSLVAENKPLEMGSLVYGDIDFFSFSNILERVQPKRGEVFYDLGHGTGRAIAGANLLYGHMFSACCGIEILPVLFDISVTAISQLKDLLNDQAVQEAQSDRNPVSGNYLKDHSSDISILQGDFLENLQWLTADVIFINSTCFDDVLMSKLSALILEHVKDGSRVVSFTRPLTPHCTTDLPPDSNNWIEMFDRRQFVMSWGTATVFFHLIHKATGSSDKVSH